MNLLNEIKERKIRKSLAIYVSAGITSIGLVHLFSLRYKLPTYIFDSLLIILLFGLISVSIFAWFHGKEGKQKFRTREIILHSMVFISASLSIYFFTYKSPIKILPINSKTVAVLPFVNMSNSPEDEYFSDGITEDILTQLSKINELKVISRTSTMKYKNTELSIPEIGRELGAGTILEGSVRHIGDRIRITGQLINANSDEHIWAETFDRNTKDIFALQSEIAKYIATKLEAKLAPKEEKLLEIKPTSNFEAYALCLKGRQLASKYNDEDNERAINYYKDALKLDSNYALAYAGLASSYDQKVRRYFYANSWRDSAIAMSKKALSLNPDLAEGHSSLAKSYEALGKNQLAKFHYKRAINLVPNYYAAIYNLGVVYFNEGSLDNAYKLIEKSILLEPDNVFGYIVMGGIFQKLDCDESAIHWFKKALKLEPQNLLAHIYIIEQFLLMDDLLQAEEYFKNLMQINPDWLYTYLTGAKVELLRNNFKKSFEYMQSANKISDMKGYEYAYLLKRLNDTTSAESLLNSTLGEYKEEMKNKESENSSIYIDLSNIYSLIGDQENAIGNYEKAVKKGWIEYKKNLVYPYMDSIKSDRNFKLLIKRTQKKIDSMKTIIKSFSNDWIDCY